MQSSRLAPLARHLPYVGLAALSLAAAAATDVRAADLSVTVEGMRSPDAPVMFALFDRADGFPSADRRMRESSVPAGQPGGVTTVFRNLPAGRYALAVFQDLNGNGRLDRNLVGMPTEPYGFSNNAFGMAGPPSFDQTALDLSADLAITIKLR